VETGKEVRCRSFVVDVENHAGTPSAVETRRQFAVASSVVDEEDHAGTPSGVEMNEAHCLPYDADVAGHARMTLAV
jgi:hypothetical protein